MYLIVTHAFEWGETVQVLVYEANARKPLLNVSLPKDAFPHEPAVAERFELVVA